MYNHIITAPTTEPVTVEEVKIQARYDDPDLTDEDGLIAADITAARELCEFKLQRSIMPQVREVVLAGFPADGCIELAFPIVRQIDSVKYMDANGVEQTLNPSQYTLINYKQNASAYLLRNPNVVWPVTDANTMLAVKVRYSCGWANVEAVPQNIKKWIKQVCATWLKHREMVTDGDRAVRPLPDDFCKGLIGKHKVWGL